MTAATLGLRQEFEKGEHAVRTSMSGSVANSPVMGSCAIEEPNLALASLRSPAACEGRAPKNVQRDAARRMELNVGDIMSGRVHELEE